MPRPRIVTPRSTLACDGIYAHGDIGMRVTLGVNTAFAVKRWPRVEDWSSLVRDELGVSTVQVCLDLVDLRTSATTEREASRHRTALSKHGLTADSTFTGVNAYSTNLLLHPNRAGRASAQRWYERAIRFTAAIGGRGTGGHVGAYSVPDWSDARRREALNNELRTRLRALAGYSMRAGLSYFAVENLASVREPGTIKQVDALLTARDSEHVPVMVCVDVGHQCVPGMVPPDADPYAWLRHFARKACAIHLQQNDGTDRHWPFTVERNATGVIDAERVLDALEAGGASDVLLVLEITEPPREPDTAVVDHLRESVAYWAAAIAARRGA
jgi:sugar phosphate isomerase/epimerase